MNAFEQFLQDKPNGFLNRAQLLELEKLHRLCLVVVRLRGLGGRFMCPAQNARVLMAYCERALDPVRDVSIHQSEIDRAPRWQPERPPAMPPNYTAGRGGRLTISLTEPEKRQQIPDNRFFDESACGGAFDGFTVTSDADPGL